MSKVGKGLAHVLSRHFLRGLSRQRLHVYSAGEWLHPKAGSLSSPCPLIPLQMQSTQTIQWKLCKLLTKAHLISSLECSLRRRREERGCPPRTRPASQDTSAGPRLSATSPSVVYQIRGGSEQIKTTPYICMPHSGLESALHVHRKPDTQCFDPQTPVTLLMLRLSPFEPQNILLSCYPILQRREVEAQISYIQPFKNTSWSACCELGMVLVAGTERIRQTCSPSS